MKELNYKDFSLKVHKKNWYLGRPNQCQFELTFRCAFNCSYCYTGCYNQPHFFKKELKTKQVKIILDKMYEAGVIWLCFTGGDPLLRSDFPDIYTYAKKKGFLLTLFTNGYFLNNGMLDFLKENPPFAIEITLNSMRRRLYEDISGVKGSFERVMRGIDGISKARLPLKIKVQATRKNFCELPKIERFAANRKIDFEPNHQLFPKLNGDSLACSLRIEPEKIAYLYSGKEKTKKWKSRCLFHCAVGSTDGFFIDPYGNLILCPLIRQPKVNLLDTEFEGGWAKLLVWFRNKRFLTGSKCADCNLREGCLWCPGKAYLEKGNMEEPINYYCILAGKNA